MLAGGLMVRVEKIYQDDNPPRALTRRVGGPNDGITAICEVAKLEPCDETNDAEPLKCNPV
jgi:hypothetical protein